jgi:hypothetical protein
MITANAANSPKHNPFSKHSSNFIKTVLVHFMCANVKQTP